MTLNDDFNAAWSPQGRQRAHVNFTGNAGEYFRIWIVNILLTILTLGVYLAWAKVRTRRYFYWNTFLDGHHFDYLAKPRSILTGHLIVFAVLILGNTAKEFWPDIGWYVSLTIYSMIPWLIYKAHRFKARYSSYRGIRFRFAGTAGGAYKVYALLPSIFLIGAILIGIITTADPDEANFSLAGLLSFPLLIAAAALYPYWTYLRRRYTFKNLAFGKTQARFRPNPRFFYKTYFSAGGLGVGAVVASFLITAILFGAMNLSRALSSLSYAAVLAPVAVALLAYLLLEQFVYARITNHCWNSLRIGQLRFQVELEPWRLVWLRITNIIAVVASFGLMTPWAQVRRYNYVTSRFTVFGVEELDNFVAAQDNEVDALGDAAADYIDLDIGW